MKRCARPRPLSRGLLSDEELKTAITKLGMSPDAIKQAASSGSGSSEWKRSRARMLYDEGTRLASSGDNKGAAQSFEAAYQLVPHPATAEAIATARSSGVRDEPRRPIPGEASDEERWRSGGALPSFVSSDDPRHDAWETELTRRYMAKPTDEEAWRSGGELPSFVAGNDRRYDAWASELTKRALPRLESKPSESERWAQGEPLPSFVASDDPRYQAWEDEVTRRAMRRLADPPKPQLADVNWKDETKDETISDERLKDTVRAYGNAPPGEQDRALAAMRPKSFRYKPEAIAMGAPRGRVDGVMAQDLQKAPLSRSVVNERPGEPLTLNRDKAISLALAGVARLNERVDEALSRRARK